MKNHLTFLFLFLVSTMLSQSGLNIYVSSRNTNSIKRYQTDGTFLDDFVAPAAGGLGKPQDLFFHPIDSTLIVTGIDNHAIFRYDPNTGEFLGNFSSGYSLDRPTKMAIGEDDLIYVSQWGTTQNKVARFGLDGNFVDEFTSTGVPNGCGMTWDDQGNLYVASYGNGVNGSVHRFDDNGNFLGIFINTSILQGPVGLWQNEVGEWLVTDWTKGSVERFTEDGTHLGAFISGLENVEGHTFDAAGNIYLCDWSADVVNRYLSDGTFDEVFINTGGPVAPNSIIFGPAPKEEVSALYSSFGQKISVFPNPFRDTFALSLKNLDGHNIRIELFDTSGKLVHEQEEKIKSESVRLASKNLPTGNYLCKVWIGKQLVFSQTVIKQ